MGGLPYPVEIGMDKSGVSKHYAERLQIVASDPKKEIGIQKNKKTPFGLKVSVI